jgi:phosphoglycolate phosphatase
MRCRAVVFDLDGTLIDSRTDIALAANHALAENGFPTLSVERVSGYVGDGAELLLTRAAAIQPGDPRLPALYAAFIAFYCAHPADHTRLCPGAAEALDGRLMLPLALCTNKPRITTEPVLAALGLDGFHVVVAGGDLPEKKPHPAPLFHIAQALAVEPRELVMVGDGAQDVLAGRAAGARTVGVRGGIQAEARLFAAEPDVVIESLAELSDLVASWR